jgi:hypothetical protein
MNAPLPEEKIHFKSALVIAKNIQLSLCVCFQKYAYELSRERSKCDVVISMECGYNRFKTQAWSQKSLDLPPGQTRGSDSVWVGAGAAQIFLGRTL